MPTVIEKTTVWATPVPDETRGVGAVLLGADPGFEGYGRVRIMRVTRVQRWSEGARPRLLEEFESKRPEVLAELDADQALGLVRSLTAALVDAHRVQTQGGND